MTRMERFLHTMAAVLRLPAPQGRHHFTPPPAVPPSAPDDETTFFPRINSRPYEARQETTL